MSEAAIREAVLKEHLHTLKMPGVAKEYPALARQAGDAGWSYEEFLRQILEAEIRSRQERTAVQRVREAHFPDIKTLDQLDWKVLQGLSKSRLLQLASCDYLGRAEDVILAGPIGTGKTHIAIGLGVEAARRRFHVCFTRAAELVRMLLEARDERLLERLHRRLEKSDLLIVDELGFVPFDRAGGELLFNLLSDRYERRSTLIRVKFTLYILLGTMVYYLLIDWQVGKRWIFLKSYQRYLWDGISGSILPQSLESSWQSFCSESHTYHSGELTR